MKKPHGLTTEELRARLHDGLCQQLTGALMFSRVLADALVKRDDPLAKDAELLFQMVNDAADEVHALMRSLENIPSDEPADIDK